MSPIENAAREFYECDGIHQRYAAAVIYRNLFESVAPSDVQLGSWYWVNMPGHPIGCREPWKKGETIMFGSYEASECEVMGPIPMPTTKES